MVVVAVVVVVIVVVLVPFLSDMVLKRLDLFKY